MKRYILLFALIFFASINWAQAQRPTPTGGCTQSFECYEFNYLGATALDGDLMQLKFTLQISCNQLAYVAFELPEGSEATNPASVYHNNAPAYRVRNGEASEQGPNEVEPPFNAIQFNAKQTYTLSEGAIDTFSFNLTAADFEALSTMRVRATLRSGTKGNKDIITGSQQVVFDLSACGPMAGPDACVIETETANFAFVGASDNGDGTTTVNLMVQNTTAADVNTVQIETIATPTPIGVANMTNGNVYSTAANQYKVSIDQDANLITFEGQNTNGYANGATDVFAVIIPTDLYQLEPYFQITVDAGGIISNTGLNTITCEDAPITPLPVELVSFEGKATASGVSLTWSTASELDNDRFELERSQDGKSFGRIAEVKGAGNSNVLLKYSYTDATAEPGMNYYRIKQVDFDGDAEYSNVIAVNQQQRFTKAMELYPNPVTSSVLNVAMQNNTGALLQIMDRNGRTVYTQQVSAGQHEIQLSVADLNVPKGLYYVHMRGEGSQQVQKLIIQ